MKRISYPRLSPAYQKAYAALYGRASDRHPAFRRDRLPDSADYYREHFGTLPTRGEWASVRCPFHVDKSPSLSINLTHGGFVYHACGVRGGDILSFHRQLAGVGFIEAAKDLCAWEDFHD